MRSTGQRGAIALLLAAAGLLAASSGCASSSSRDPNDVYYSRGAHRDAYPPAGMPGSPIRYGRPYYY
jgi:hypothetical protein